MLQPATDRCNGAGYTRSCTSRSRKGSSAQAGPRSPSSGSCCSRCLTRRGAAGPAVAASLSSASGVGRWWSPIATWFSSLHRLWTSRKPHGSWARLTGRTCTRSMRSSSRFVIRSVSDVYRRTTSPRAVPQRASQSEPQLNQTKTPRRTAVRTERMRRRKRRLRKRGSPPRWIRSCCCSRSRATGRSGWSCSADQEGRSWRRRAKAREACDGTP